MNVAKKKNELIIVEGTGSDRVLAFSDALSQVQKKVLRNSSEVILKIEPKNITILNAEEKHFIERFLFFFMPREKKSCSVRLQIEVEILIIEVDNIEFIKKNQKNQFSFNKPFTVKKTNQ